MKVRDIRNKLTPASLPGRPAQCGWLVDDDEENVDSVSELMRVNDDGSLSETFREHYVQDIFSAHGVDVKFE